MQAFFPVEMCCKLAVSEDILKLIDVVNFVRTCFIDNAIK